MADGCIAVELKSKKAHDMRFLFVEWFCLNYLDFTLLGIRYLIKMREVTASLS